MRVGEMCGGEAEVRGGKEEANRKRKKKEEPRNGGAELLRR